MSLTPLTALSPVDGRYAARCADLREIFSEQGLIRARVRVEIAWLHALASERRIGELRGLLPADLAAAQQIADGFSDADAAAVKAFERETNHDVKAVEYLIKGSSRTTPPGARGSNSCTSPAPRKTSTTCRTR